MVLEGWLAGVQDCSGGLSSVPDESTEKTTRGRKREIKAAAKDEEKRERAAAMQPASAQDVPLTINFDRFIDHEKKQFVLDFAKVKLSRVNAAARLDGDDPAACFSDSIDYKVFQAIVDVCETGTRLTNVDTLRDKRYTVNEILVACEANNVDFESGMADHEADVSVGPSGLSSANLKMAKLKQVLESLANNTCAFLKRAQSLTGFGHSKDAGVSAILHYCVNWAELIKQARNSFMENIVENTTGLGIYHVRVLRILRKKGYLNENDIKLLSLLPPRDARAVINQLKSKGFLKHLQVPQQKVSGQSAPSHLQTVYAADYEAMRRNLTERISQTMLNIVARHGSLGRMSGLTREFNALYF